MFTVATAISRLTGSGKSAFPPEWSPAQQLQRINEVLERFYEFGTWRGVHEDIALTSVSSIVSLPAAYQRLDGLSDSCFGRIDIKTKAWEYSPGRGGAVHDHETFCQLVAIDLGDNASGIRRYQLTGLDATNDARTLKGLARKRFVWITNTADVVIPDSFQALKLGVQALQWEDEGDTARYQAVFAEAIAALNGNISEFDSVTSYGKMQIDPAIGMGCVENLV